METLYRWTPLIVVHAVAAVACIIIGARLLIARKGTGSHRRLGWVWVVLMATVALVSFGIQRDGYSWIHGLSVFTLIMLTIGMFHARRHRANSHGKTMKGIFVGALVVTGLFTLLPGRLIGHALFLALGLK